MEKMMVSLNGIELASVPLGSTMLDDIAREAVWLGEEIEIRASLSNETLSLQIHCEKESVLIFVGKISGPATFECKVIDGKKLTITFS